MAMAGFTAKDLGGNNNKYLEFSLNAYNAYPPSLTVTIREGNNSAVAFIGGQYIPALANHIAQPMTAGPVTDKGNVIRRGTDFVVTSHNGSNTAQVTLDDNVFQNLISYLNQIYVFMPVIKEINNNIRMTVAQLFQQAGFSSVTTYWSENKNNNQAQQQPQMQQQMPQAMPSMPQQPMMQPNMPQMPSAAPNPNGFAAGMQSMLDNVFNAGK